MSEISPTNFLLVSFPLYNKLKIQVFEKFAKEGFKAKSTPKTEDL